MEKYNHGKIAYVLTWHKITTFEKMGVIKWC